MRRSVGTRENLRKNRHQEMPIILINFMMSTDKRNQIGMTTIDVLTID
jgi:hypothetical protein